MGEDIRYIGYALVILGVALVVVGTLNVAGILNFQTVDTTPPKIIYTYPANGMTYKSSDLNEIVVYAQDSSTITSASYSDKYGLKTLTITPYIQLKHPLIPQGYRKFPDANYDGRVDATDTNLFNLAFGSSRGDPNYNEACDMDANGVVDNFDISLLGIYYGTTTFASIPTVTYSAGEKITFTFSALDQYGNNGVLGGSFTVADYAILSGTWKINGKTVTDSMMIELSNTTMTVIFICNDTSVTSTQVTVKATVGANTYTLSYVGDNTWKKSIQVPNGLSAVLLEASTIDKLNKISVIIKAPEAPTFTIGHALIVSGGILVICAVIVLTKKEELW